MEKVVKLVGWGSVINGAYPVYFFLQIGGACWSRVCYQQAGPTPSSFPNRPALDQLNFIE